MNSSSVPSNLEWLKKECPGFALHGDKIKVLFSPGEYYSSLIDGCRKSKHRIALAALYIGTGILEHKLIDTLDKRMCECGEKLKVSFLLDNVRGSRDQSVKTMLLPLLAKHPHCQVALYHSPQLRGLLLRLLPAKLNEVVGLQHIKLYVFDDDVIITGANLTKEYFTDRQDRYMLVSDCTALADFCHGLVERLGSVSLQLTADNTLTAPQPHLHPYSGPAGQYERFAREVVWGYCQQTLSREGGDRTKPGDDTWVFPLLQLPPLDVCQDSTVTEAILESMPTGSTVHMTSPYFNLPDSYVMTLLRKCKTAFHILIPHPTASDFFGARGLVGQIPWLYATLAAMFVRRAAARSGRLRVSEFRRAGGTYHAKGVWLTAPGEDLPHATIIGSSNFNYRSVERDLECQLVIVTNNERLRQSLHEERHRLYKHGVPFREERKPRLWHYLFLWAFKGFL